MTDTNDQGLQIGPTLDSLDDTVTNDFVEVTREDVQTEETPAEELIGGKFKTNDDPASEDTPEIDVVKYANEFFESGELSEASYKELADNHKLPKEIVDTFMSGVQANQQLRMHEIHNAAGGEAEYKAMVDWGTKNLTEDDIASYNDALDKAVLQGDYRDLNTIVKGIKAQMGGTEPKYLKATTSNTSGSTVKPFANRTEMQRAMADKRYSTDPKYNAEVVARLAVSDI